MNPRERLKLALEHKEPDQVPTDLGTIVSTVRKGVYSRLREYFGIPRLDIGGSPLKKIKIENAVLEKLGVDTRNIITNPPNRSREAYLDDGSFINEWGVKYHFPKDNKLSYVPVGSTLSEGDISDIDKYNWPDPFDPGRTQGLREEARLLNDENKYAIVGNVERPSIFEVALALRGFEKLLMDMAIDEGFADRLLDKVTEIQILMYEKLLDEAGEYLDVIVFGDDIGVQNSLLISPEMYRRFIKPRHKMLFDAIRRKTKAKIFFHTCGNVYSIIQDFIEIGVDILNPIQVASGDMGDTRRLKAEFGKDIVFWGAIDTQYVLPFGTPEEVRTEVRHRINDLAVGGGYVIAPVHNIQDEVPPQNIVAMFDEARKSGKY